MSKRYKDNLENLLKKAMKEINIETDSGIFSISGTRSITGICRCMLGSISSFWDVPEKEVTHRKHKDIRYWLLMQARDSLFGIKELVDERIACLDVLLRRESNGKFSGSDTGAGREQGDTQQEH